jgi:hypothetical protein
MADHMSHEDYVLQVRGEAVRTCAGILDGSVCVLEGCHLLSSLRWEVELDERDPDFLTFAMISSEIEGLPIGNDRQHWSKAALAELEPDVRAAVAWAMPIARGACQSVVERFATEPSA